MFSSFARSRLFLLSFLFLSPPFVLSREKALFASSVTYCQPPESLLIDRFDIAFFPRNQSVSFNISAASVQENVNVTANLLLNVYGMTPVNVTLDLCNILGGALCPLPTYNFTGADSISLPDSLGVSNKVPGIAFVIPDLEGFAQLTLKEIGTGDIKACVQATLSNGWSTHQPAVEWVASSFALAAFLSAVFHSVFPDSLAPLRFLDLFYLYQAIATSAFLDLNYASLYRSFTLNFAWAVGLVSTSHSSLQDSIDRMRHHTGGQLANSTSSSAVGFVNRKLSPYNTHLTSPIILIQRDVNKPGEILAALPSTLRAAPIQAPPRSNFSTNLAMQSAVQGQVQTVTNDSSNVLEAGIPIYSNSLHIGTGNAFMTSFIVCLITLAIGILLLACGYLIVRVISRARVRRGRLISFDYRSFVHAWLLRLGLIFLLPLLIFAFYQWTLNDSWLAIVLAVLTILGLLVLLFHPPYLITKFVRGSREPYELYNHAPPTYLTSLGPLYAHLRPERYYVFLLYLVIPLLKAIFISFVSASGFAQIILLVITEFVVLGIQITLKPHRTRGGNILNTYLGVTRLVCTGLMIAFVEHINVKAIPRTIIGAVITVIWSVAVVVLILDLVVFHMFLPIWQVATGRFNTRPRPNTPQTSAASMLEKAEQKSEDDHSPVKFIGVTPAPSWDRGTVRRASNPTPDHSIPFDEQIGRPYPVSPTESVNTDEVSELPSMYSVRNSGTTGTTTVGSLLPRRWSFGSGLGPLATSPGLSSAHGTGSSSRPNSAQISQPSTPSSPAVEQSDESTGIRLEAIKEAPSQSSGLEVLHHS